jgi:hypothetical protein
MITDAVAAVANFFRELLRVSAPDAKEAAERERLSAEKKALEWLKSTEDRGTVDEDPT